MSRLLKIVRALSPNCKEAIRLQSDAMDRPLTSWQRAGLRMHLWLCKWCRRYGRQVAFLRTIARDCDHVHEPPPGMPPAARERIKQAVKIAEN